MDLKQLRYFLALAEERSFGRAAARLHITQPPLSRNIKMLEDQLGTPLFQRTPRGIQLTAAGRTLLEDAPGLLMQVKRTEERVQETARGATGRLEVGLFTSSVLDLIPHILSRFRASRPNVKIGLHTMSKLQQIEAIRDKRINIGFNRFVPDVEGIAVEDVARENVVVGLPSDHPLADSRRAITLKDLEDQSMILYPNLPIAGMAQEIAVAFTREKSRLRVVQEVEDLLTAVGLVSAGFGLCITAESATKLQLPNVVYRPLDSRWLRTISLSCLYRSDDRSPVLQSFLDVVREVKKERAQAATGQTRIHSKSRKKPSRQ